MNEEKGFPGNTLTELYKKGQIKEAMQLLDQCFTSYQLDSSGKAYYYIQDSLLQNKPGQIIEILECLNYYSTDINEKMNFGRAGSTSFESFDLMVFQRVCKTLCEFFNHSALENMLGMLSPALLKAGEKFDLSVQGIFCLACSTEGTPLCVIRKLVEEGANINGYNAAGEPLFLTVIRPGNEAVIDYFLAKNVDLKKDVKKSREALVNAIKINNMSLFETLLERGVKVHDSLIAFMREHEAVNYLEKIIEHVPRFIEKVSKNHYLSEDFVRNRPEVCHLWVKNGVRLDESDVRFGPLKDFKGNNAQRFEPLYESLKNLQDKLDLMQDLTYTLPTKAFITRRAKL